MNNLYILFLFLIIVGCSSGGGNVAGNGSETGNPRVIGTIRGGSGAVVAHASIVVCPENYTPFSTGFFDTISTDAQGHFDLALPDSGRYFMVIFSGDSLTGTSMPLTVLRDSVQNLGTITLYRTASLTVKRTSSLSRLQLYASGTMLNAVFETGADSVLIAHIPVGGYRFRDFVAGMSLFTLTFADTSSPAMDITLKPEFLVTGPNQFDTLTPSVQQILLAADTTKYSISLTDAQGAINLFSRGNVPAGVVVLCGVTKSDSLVGILDTLTLPVLVSDPQWYSLLHMTDDTSFGADSLQSILLNGETMSSHPILAPLNLTVNSAYSIVLNPEYLGWGKPSSDADIVASGVVDQSKKFIFAYEKNKKMIGKTSPARRVGLPFGNGTISFQGEQLYTNALNWFYLN